MNPKDSLQIIKDLERESREKEEQFFNRIAERLGRPRITKPPYQPVRGVPDFWKKYQLAIDEPIQLFMKNWERLGGVANKLSTKAELSAAIKEIVNGLMAKNIIHWDDPLLNNLDWRHSDSSLEITVWNQQQEDLLSKAANADIGIVVADYAIAHTGTIVVQSGMKKGRSVSLLPTAMIAVIPAQMIKTRMGEILSEIQALNGQKMPAGIHFITGPSRSSDIENDLTIGVHGPGIVYALILEEENKERLSN
jgi:L-lactate dehydrogenase complex protein LldG